MAQPMSSMAHTKHSSPTYQSAPMTHTSSVSYQFGSTTHPSSAYQPGPTTHPSPAYQPGPTTHPSRAYEPSHTTHPSPAYQPNPTTHPSPSYQSAPNLASVEKSRSRSRKKCFWEESETQLLIEVLQDMACDPSWKTDTGFRSNYLCEVHRRILVKRPSFSKKVSPHIKSKVKWLKTKFHAISDMLKQSGCSWNDIDKKIACEKEWYLSYCKNHKDAQGLWDFEFPYFNQLEVVYGRDRATGLVAEGYEDAIHNLEVEQNVENGGENLGEVQFTLSDEENDVHYMSQATQTASNFNATKMANKQKTSTIGGKAAKKRKTRDIETQLEGINHAFQTFVEGFNANFGTMANAVANAMTEDNMRKKAESEKLKDVLDELIRLDIPSGDVLHAGEIFAANKDKMDLFMNLSKPLRVSYVLKLMGLSSSK